MAENRPMIEVFRDSGFETRSRLSDGLVDVQLSLRPSDRGVAAAEERRRLATTASLAPLFAPRAVAVVGASRDPASIGGRIMAALSAAGFHWPHLSREPARHAGRRAAVAIGPHVICRLAWIWPLWPSRPPRCSAWSTIAPPPA